MLISGKKSRVETSLNAWISPEWSAYFVVRPASGAEAQARLHPVQTTSATPTSTKSAAPGARTRRRRSREETPGGDSPEDRGRSWGYEPWPDHVASLTSLYIFFVFLPQVQNDLIGPPRSPVSSTWSSAPAWDWRGRHMPRVWPGLGGPGQECHRWRSVNQDLPEETRGSRRTPDTGRTKRIIFHCC